MQEQIAAIMTVGGILSSVSNNLDTVASIIDNYLSGANNLRMASIILMLLAFILFLFLIIIIYVKSIVAFLRSDNQKPQKTDDEDDIFNDDDAERLNQFMEDQERERELEKELQKELEMARAEKEMFEQNEKKKKLEEEKLNQQSRRQEEKQIEKRKNEENQRQAERNAAEIKSAMVVDLDWAKGKLKEVENAPQNLSADILSYRQTKKDLSDLLGLIIDMIGRGVDDLKIAQTVMFRNQGKNTEDDILQTIEAIKEFINLCVNGQFDHLDKHDNFPREDDALYHLAQGDPTLALAMTETLMDYNIDRSTNTTALTKREELFKDVSNQACVFGSLAAINDIHLATGAFELAIELYPNNINAWSRVGDMYARAESNNKAIWAYQNVLKQADEDIYARQVANANKMMSQYLYDQGNSLQAAKLYNSSKQYYDSLGINRHLDKQEMEIVEIIESHQKDEIQQTIQKILSQKNAAVYNFI